MFNEQIKEIISNWLTKEKYKISIRIEVNTGAIIIVTKNGIALTFYTDDNNIFVSYLGGSKKIGELTNENLLEE